MIQPSGIQCPDNFSKVHMKTLTKFCPMQGQWIPHEIPLTISRLEIVPIQGILEVEGRKERKWKSFWGEKLVPETSQGQINCVLCTREGISSWAWRHIWHQNSFLSSLHQKIEHESESDSISRFESCTCPNFHSLCQSGFQYRSATERKERWFYRTSEGRLQRFQNF